MKLSLIISTYNSVDWLEKVIWGYAYQSYKDFELILADDGSTKETKERVDKLRSESGLTIHHLWHEDKGFRKTEILNKAIVKSSGDYLVFSDGDCIPRSDFLATHVEKAERGFFLSGGYFKLAMDVSKLISKEDIKAARCFDSKWLIQNGLKKSHKLSKLTKSKQRAKLLNFLTPTKATWNGHNASTWKSDLLAVNGFDERMRYGGEDRELGDRLANFGMKAKQIRYSAICVHLDHERSYVTDEDWNRNNKIRKESQKKKRIQTDFGIQK